MLKSINIVNDLTLSTQYIVNDAILFYTVKSTSYRLKSIQVLKCTNINSNVVSIFLVQLVKALTIDQCSLLPQIQPTESVSTSSSIRSLAQFNSQNMADRRQLKDRHPVLTIHSSAQSRGLTLGMMVRNLPSSLLFHCKLS